MRGWLSVSYRRRWLDRDLTQATSTLSGLVVDLGGEWRQRRGVFRPPQRRDLCWVCVNRDATVAPDIVGDVACVPLADACADAVICTEILEHVAVPAAVVAEAYRLLRLGGWLVLSMPFLYPIHADPYDYQRYTAVKLKQLLQETGFSIVDMHPQGLYFTVLADMMRSGLAHLRPTLLRWGLAVLFLPLAYGFRQLEIRLMNHPVIASYPGGYFVMARKPASDTDQQVSCHADI